MATIRFSLSKKVTGGKAEIMIYFSAGRGIRQYSGSRIFVRPEFWEYSGSKDGAGTIDKQYTTGRKRTLEAVETAGNMTQIEAFIIDEFSKSDKAMIQKRWLERVIDGYHNPKQKVGTLLTVYREFCESNHSRLLSDGKKVSDGTIEAYETAEKVLKRYIQSIDKEDMRLEEVNQGFYDDFVSYLSNKGYKINYIGKQIKMLKSVLNSLEDGVKADIEFLHKGKCRKMSEDVEAVYLNRKELEQIENYKFPKGEFYDMVKDWFLLLCWTGCRYSDLNKLNKGNVQNGCFHFQQQKTGNVVTIPIHPVVQSILDKYQEIIPQPIDNRRFNESVKEVARLAGITERVKMFRIIGGKRETIEYQKWQLISSHTGRRSFATNSFLDGVPPLTIMSITGHKTEAAFLRYIRVSSEEHAKLMKETWERLYQE